MLNGSRFDFSPHSVDRFRERILKWDLCPYNEALRQMSRAALSATRLKQTTHDGCIIWRCDDPAMILITKPEKRRFVCVTIVEPDNYTVQAVMIEPKLLPAGPINKHQQRIEELLKQDIAVQAARTKEDTQKAQRRMAQEELNRLAQERLLVKEQLELATKNLLIEKEKRGQLVAIASREAIQAKKDRIADHTNHNLKTLKTCLRIAIKGLIGETTPGTAVSNIGNVESRFLTEGFLRSEN